MDTKFAATYKGETFTRGSKTRTYTHVVIAYSSYYDGAVAYRWSSTEANAIKGAKEVERLGGRVLAIIECAPEGEQAPAAVEAVEEQQAEAAPVEEPTEAAATLYRPAAPRSRGAGHHRRPGTTASYCGRTVEATPSPDAMFTGTCKQCAKAETADRIAAEQHAAAFSVDTPPLTERAGVRYCTVGTGRRVHLSNNDDTLCGREVTEYTDGSAFVGGAELCARCDRAAEERAYARALAAASPLAVTVVQAEPANVNPNEHRLALLRTAIETQGGKWTTERAAALYDVAGVVIDRHSVWGTLLWLAEGDTLLTQLDNSGVFVIAADVEDVEARPSAALVTEAEATEGTWQAEWIGKQATAPALFDLDQADAEQGALFA
jgi:hypothetical protein